MYQHLRFYRGGQDSIVSYAEEPLDVLVGIHTNIISPICYLVLSPILPDNVDKDRKSKCNIQVQCVSPPVPKPVNIKPPTM